MSRSCEEDPAFDYLLTLLLESTAEPLTILPTHRVVRGLGTDGLASTHEGLGELFEVRTASRAELLREFEGSVAGGGAGRFGLWTRDGGALLTARRAAFADEVRTADIDATAGRSTAEQGQAASA